MAAVERDPGFEIVPTDKPRLPHEEVVRKKYIPRSRRQPINKPPEVPTPKPPQPK